MADSEDLDSAMAAYAAQAIELIEQGLGHTPDFTPDSVVLIEAMAGCIHADLPQDFLDTELERDPWDKEGDAELQALCLIMGGYVGEVARRAHGGGWVMEEAEPASPPSQMLRVLPGLWLNPVGWVRNRLLLGPAHNIFATFENAVSEETLARHR
jgi:hypothetical protein